MLYLTVVPRPHIVIKLRQSGVDWSSRKAKEFEIPGLNLGRGAEYCHNVWPLASHMLEKMKMLS